MLDKGDEIKLADVQAALQREGISEGSIKPGDASSSIPAGAASG